MARKTGMAKMNIEALARRSTPSPEDRDTLSRSILLSSNTLNWTGIAVQKVRYAPGEVTLTARADNGFGLQLSGTNRIQRRFLCDGNLPSCRAVGRGSAIEQFRKAPNKSILDFSEREKRKVWFSLFSLHGLQPSNITALLDCAIPAPPESPAHTSCMPLPSVSCFAPLYRRNL
jgi:hypothetical protein